MGKKDVINMLRHLRGLLENQNIHVERLILFGSWAKGTQQEGSDIDIVVISKDFNGMGYWARINILSDVIYQVFLPIQAVAMTPEEWQSKASPVVEFAQIGEIIAA